MMPVTVHESQSTDMRQIREMTSALLLSERIRKLLIPLLDILLDENSCVFFILAVSLFQFFKYFISYTYFTYVSVQAR